MPTTYMLMLKSTRIYANKNDKMKFGLLKMPVLLR